MRAESKSLCLLSSVLLLVAAPALADYDAAVSAYDAGDYATAREELSGLESGMDGRVHLLLGLMNWDGQGGPVDLIEAYRNLTLAAMYAEDGEAIHEALGERAIAAREMSADEIVSSERLVAATVTSRLTEEGLRLELQDIHDALTACPSRCEDFALKVVELGPAAGQIAPDLEALMTRDPFWLSRDKYAFALMSIGTEAVPSLSRILIDGTKSGEDGLWNMQLASGGLTWLGPTAFAARAPLLQALEFDHSGIDSVYGEMFSALGEGSTNDMILSVRATILTTIAAIGDPDREIHAGLYAFMERETESTLRLIAAGTIASTYQEYEPVAGLLRETLESGLPRDQLLALAMIWDFGRQPQARDLIEELQPLVRSLTESADPDVRSEARQTMQLYVVDLVETAIEALRRKDYPSAIATVDAAIEIDPWSASVLEVRAIARRNNGDIDGAISDLNQSMKLAENSYSVQFALERAGVLEGNLTGDVDDATRKAMEDCLRDDACFERFQKYD